MGTISNLVKDDAISGNILSQRLWIEDEIKEFLEVYSLVGYKGMTAPELKVISMEFMDILGLISKFKVQLDKISFFLDRIPALHLILIIQFSNCFDILECLNERDAQGATQSTRLLTYWNDSQIARGREAVSEKSLRNARVFLQYTAKQIITKIQQQN